MKKEEITDVHLNRETIIHAPEHEIWISFRDDSMAATFDEWWYKEGYSRWKEYHEKNKSFYE